MKLLIAGLVTALALAGCRPALPTVPEDFAWRADGAGWSMTARSGVMRAEAAPGLVWARYRTDAEDPVYALRVIGNGAEVLLERASREPVSECRAAVLDGLAAVHTASLRSVVGSQGLSVERRERLDIIGGPSGIWGIEAPVGTRLMWALLAGSEPGLLAWTDGSLRRYTSAGKALWHADIGPAIALLASEGTGYALLKDGTLIAIGLVDGKECWRTGLKGVQAWAAAPGGLVLAADGQALALDARGGERWRVPLGAGPLTAFSASTSVLLALTGETLAALDLTDGSLRWDRQGVQSCLPAPDGQAAVVRTEDGGWLVETAGGRAVMAVAGPPGWTSEGLLLAVDGEAVVVYDAAGAEQRRANLKLSWGEQVSGLGGGGEFIYAVIAQGDRQRLVCMEGD